MLGTTEQEHVPQGVTEEHAAQSKRKHANDKILQTPIYMHCKVEPEVWKEQILTREYEFWKLANKSSLGGQTPALKKYC